MKIAIVSREYPPYTHVGGIATYSATISKILADQGHEVHVFCNGLTNLKEKTSGIWIHRIKMRPHPLPQSKIFYQFRKGFRKYLPNYLDSITWSTTVAHHFANESDIHSFDILEYPETAGEGAFIRFSKSRKPFVVARIHSSWMSAYANNFLEKVLLLSTQKKACENADRVVSPSHYMAESYGKKILKLKCAISVCKNPFQFWQAPIDRSIKKIKNILFVGRIEHRKGIHTLLDALDQFNGEFSEIVLRVVGHKHASTREIDKATQKHFDSILLTQSNRTNTENRFWTLNYLGPCSQFEMQQHYDWAGILVIPSLMENYPYVALEGLSRGCFVIGSNVGGIPEIIDRPSRGLLFDVENSTQLAEKIRECMQREFAIAAGRATVVSEMNLEFSSEKTYQDLMEVYGCEFAKESKEERI